MAKKKKSDNKISDELLATPSVAEEIIAAPVIEVVKEVTPVAKAEEKRAPGMYHNGRRITRVLANIGRTWTVAIDGKREKVLKTEIEIIK